MSRMRARQGGTALRLASRSPRGLEQLRSLSSDAPEDVEFQCEILKLTRADRHVIGLIVRRVLEIEAEQGSDAAEATLEMLLRDLDGQPRPSA